MGNSEEKESKSVAAEDERQESSPTEARDGAQLEPESEPAQPTLDHARRFLQDDAVRQTPWEEKAEFLRSKGITDADIETLLDEENKAVQPAVVVSPHRQLRLDRNGQRS
jgi:hypothetical protein